MKIIFHSVYLHNFGSYKDATIDLENKGYCLVSGHNYFKKDNALSNGSGKSMIWSAICWALTGETIQGISSNLKNIYADEDDDDCVVTLKFKANTDEYAICRMYKPSNLIIVVNGEDKSGKGIRESEKLLAEYLPDLTKDLIASTVLIGQGMPNKFSSFSPSGRKELLEKLSKSDFMIEDIKTRINTRQTELDNKLREYEDLILENNTQLNISNTQLETLQNDLNELSNRPDYDKLIEDSKANINNYKIDTDKIDENIKNIELKIDTINNKILEYTNTKQVEVNTELTAYNNKRDALIESKNKNEFSIKSLKEEIDKLKSIKDICPTCGQKIPGVIKQDTSAQELILAGLEGELKADNKNLDNLNQLHTQYIQEINNEYDNKINLLKDELISLKDELLENKTRSTDNHHYLVTEETNLTKLITDKSNFEDNYNNIIRKIDHAKDLIENSKSSLDTYTKKKDSLQESIDVVKKMDTLVKRDFRGYLLQNVISFIDKKAKEYSDIVFGTTDLNVYLDGNALDITYGNKMLENLSGGERQRVDLILQFAIRDMMSTYLEYSSNILVLDEIFDNLDQVATDKVLELINTKLIDIDSIFIISHHADELGISCDSELVIEKNEFGISEVK